MYGKQHYIIVIAPFDPDLVWPLRLNRLTGLESWQRWFAALPKNETLGQFSILISTLNLELFGTSSVFRALTGVSQFWGYMDRFSHHPGMQC